MSEFRPILSALLRHKSSTILIILQIAITFAVVVNSFSIINQRMDKMDRTSGIKESQLMTFNLYAYEADYNVEQNIRADIELLRNTPGVIDVIATNQVPLSGSGDSGSVASSQENFDNFVNIRSAFFRSDSHLLNTYGLQLSEGRNFTEDEIIYSNEQVNIPSILITQSLANKLYPDGDALGKQVYLGSDSPTIIGIIKQMGGPWVWADSFYEDNIIFPYISLSTFKRFVIRTEPNAREELLGSVEKLLLDRNRNRVISSIRSLDELRERAYSGDAAMTKILWSVSLLLLVITALGIVGIASFNVNQRIKQIGTRRALGATRIDIQRYFIIENIIITSLGLIIGSLLTILFNTYLVDSFELTPVNWTYIPVGIITMLLVGIISVWMPAKKASGVSPAIATQSV